MVTDSLFYFYSYMYFYYYFIISQLFCKFENVFTRSQSILLPDPMRDVRKIVTDEKNLHAASYQLLE